MAKTRIVRARSWSELPEILEPGVYYVNGTKIVIRETVEKDEVMMFTRGVKKLADKYYS